MLYKNNGRGAANVVQNHFTAYVVTAVRRRKIALTKIEQRNRLHELPFEVWECTAGIERGLSDPSQSMIWEPSTYEELQFENERFELAFSQLSKRERYVLWARILEERDFEDLAVELGMTYKGVAAIYYRAIQKVRRGMCGDQ